MKGLAKIKASNPTLLHKPHINTISVRRYAAPPAKGPAKPGGKPGGKEEIVVEYPEIPWPMTPRIRGEIETISDKGGVRLMAPAGEAKSGPPLGPALGQNQINLMDFIKAFNAESGYITPGVPLPVIAWKKKDNKFAMVIKPPTMQFLTDCCLLDPAKKIYDLGKLYDALRIRFNESDEEEMKSGASQMFGYLNSKKARISIS